MNKPCESPGLSSWVRWASLVWLAVWIPSYAMYWGWVNFLHLCDVAVFLTCAGLAYNNVLLLSSQAVSSLAGGFLWCLDASWRSVVGRHLIGGTQYMWDTRFPLWVRLLSMFHVVLPLVLVAALRRTGYDHRALRLQCWVAGTLLAASRLLGPSRNLNYAFADPVFHRAFGPAPIHLALIFAALAVLDTINPEEVSTYQPYWAVRAHLLHCLGKTREASDAYDRAIGLAEDPAVRAFLLQKRG
jgi:hypothetical protein